MLALRMGVWKLVVKNGTPSLYDLSVDVHEDNDVATNNPDIVKQMVDIINREHTTSSMFKVTMPGESTKR
jgi:arylsulfatase